MIKGVIFDVDGVLLDSMSAWENLGQMYLKHLGISAEADLGEILSPMSLEEAARYLIDHYGLKCFTQTRRGDLCQRILQEKHPDGDRYIR